MILKKEQASRRSIYYWKSDRPAVVQGLAQPKRTAQIEPSLKAELERAFPGKSIALRPANGQGNHLIYHADISHLHAFVRVEDGPEGQDCLEMESRIMETLRAVRIPVPELYAVDSTRSRVPFAWQVIERIPHPDLNRVFKEGRLNGSSVMREIGVNIAEWQQIRPRGFGLFDPEISLENEMLTGFHGDYPTYFNLHLARHVHYLTQHELIDVSCADRILAAFEQHQAALDLSSPCLVHKDLALWNILGTSDSIAAFIDWEDAIGGDSMDDLSLLACFHSGDFMKSAFEGYQSVLPLPENYRQRFWLHLLRNMLVKAVIRVSAGYFDQTDNLFLINTGSSGSTLKSFTQNRIDTALRGLSENRNVHEL